MCAVQTESKKVFKQKFDSQLRLILFSCTNFQKFFILHRRTLGKVCRLHSPGIQVYARRTFINRVTRVGLFLADVCGNFSTAYQSHLCVARAWRAFHGIAQPARPYRNERAHLYRLNIACNQRTVLWQCRTMSKSLGVNKHTREPLYSQDKFTHCGGGGGSGGPTG